MEGRSEDISHRRTAREALVHAAENMPVAFAAIRPNPVVLRAGILVFKYATLVRVRAPA